MGSSGDAEFIGVRPWGRRVHPWSLGSSVVFGFIRGQWVHRSARCGSSSSSGVSRFIDVRPRVLGFIRGRLVHRGVLWQTSVSAGVAGFIGVSSASRRGSSLC